MNVTDTVVKAIKQAVEAAELRGVEVTVKITENGFFSTEQTTIEITARKVKK